MQLQMLWHQSNEINSNQEEQNKLCAKVRCKTIRMETNEFICALRVRVKQTSPNNSIKSWLSGSICSKWGHETRKQHTRNSIEDIEQIMSKHLQYSERVSNESVFATISTQESVCLFLFPSLFVFFFRFSLWALRPEYINVLNGQS